MDITIAGLYIIYLAKRACPEVLRFEPKRIPRVMFCNMGIALLTALPAVLLGVQRNTNILAEVPMWKAALAGFEDALFVLPAFLMSGNERWLFLVVSSILFTSGHSYQGWTPMLAKTFTVPVVYLLLAGEYGILTTMAAHSLQDLIAITAMRLMQ